MTIDPHRVRRLLIIKPRAVGDVLLSTVVTANLRQAFPDARIDFLTEPASIDIIRLNPSIDELVVFRPASMSGLDLIRLVRSRRYDVVIDLFSNPRTALVTRLSGATWRVGYRFRGRSYAYNVIVEPRGGSVHNTQFNLDALAAMGVPIVDRSLHLRWQAEDEAYVDEFLAKRFTSADRLVALNTGGGWYTKRWPLSSFAELGDRLATALGVRIVLPWGPGQLEDVHTVARSMRCAPFIPPETTLPQLAAFLHRCAAVVSNDSGPMHMAAAVGTPVLGIYGPTNPALQGPYGPGHRIVRKEGLSCLACNLTACPIGHPCMQTLTVDEVFSAFLPLWQSLPSPAPR